MPIKKYVLYFFSIALEHFPKIALDKIPTKHILGMIKKSLNVVFVAAFLLNTFGPMPAYADVRAIINRPYMPEPGVMVSLSPEFTPAHLKGITIHPDNALKFDFIIHKGDSNLAGQEKQEEYKKLIKYFLASLAVPDENQWVNLSPYEKDRIIKDDFGKTEMGRDLLSQDYLLKQITASLIYPEQGLGQKFWDKVYEQAFKQYGNTNIRVNTFNKVWIVPDNAVIYEKGNTAYVLKNHLKVMLEEDYLALNKNTILSPSVGRVREGGDKQVNALGSQIVREVILPALEKEVNEGKNFAMLRQVYSGMILAAWYKRALKESLLGKIYADKAKLKGMEYTSVIPAKAGIQSKDDIEGIYQRYLQAFKKGVYNYIKEDTDKYTKQVIPRKYFSGGTRGFDQAQISRVTSVDFAQASTIREDIANKMDMAAVALEEPDAAMMSRREAVGLLAGGAGLLLTEPVDALNIFSIQQNQPAKTLDATKAANWLKAQINTNGLIASFTGLHQADPSSGVTWMYNQGQAIQAFLAMGDIATAERLAKAILRLRRNGNVWFDGYMTQTGDPATKLAEQTQSQVGPAAVLGHAFLNLLEQTSDAGLAEDLLKASVGVSRFLNGLFQDRNNYGFVVTASGSRRATTEHNERAFAFYYQLYNVFNNQQHKHRAILEKYRNSLDVGGLKSRADKIIFWIQNKMWDAKLGRYQAGYENFATEQLLTSDNEQWGYTQYLAPVMAHVAGLNPRDFARGIDWLLKNLSTVTVNGITYKGVSRWKGASSLWGKGNAEAAAALSLLGRRAEAQELFRTLNFLQQGSGAVTEAYGQDTKAPWPNHFPFGSIEATVPAIIAARNYDPKFIAELASSAKPDAAMTVAEDIRQRINVQYGHYLEFSPENVEEIVQHLLSPARAIVDTGRQFVIDYDGQGNERYLSSALYRFSVRPIDAAMTAGTVIDPNQLELRWGPSITGRVTTYELVRMGSPERQLAGTLKVELNLEKKNTRIVWRGNGQGQASIEVTLPGLQELTWRQGIEALNRDHTNAAMTGADKAAVADVTKPFTRGGIDMNAANLNLQIRRDGKGVPLPVSQQDLENIKLDGLVPIILEIKPAMATPLLSELQVAGMQQAKI
ncbi:MAG: hypothetical protein Q7K71_04495 [Candidatus Omnitrophota bacterium]|nr:hypothetical protein [Candidatus Omnitrophota bacterium]